jgi:DNA-binding NarL/FixJ family response regulator
MTRIGIIDDHPLFRQGFILLLQQLRYAVSIEAGHGKEFIRQLDHQPPPDLVFLDTQLLGMDSYTVLQWIKVHHPYIPVVVLHHKNDFHLLLQLIRGGAYTHLSKTASPSVVHRTIQEVLSNHLPQDVNRL